MKKEEIKPFVHDLLHIIWEKYDESQLDRFYDRNLEGHYNDDVVSFDNLKKKLSIFKKHMPNLKVEVQDLIVENDSFVLHAIQKLNRDGKNLDIPAVLIGHLKDGKINKYWVKTEMPLEFNEN